MTFPTKHRTRILTNDVIEPLNSEIHCGTRVVGTFLDRNSVLTLVYANVY